MQTLESQLNKLIDSLSVNEREQLKNRLDDLISVYPFNQYEYIISSLLGLGKITLDDYLEIRDEYIARNMFLYIFEISAPRGFGEQWAQGHLKGLIPELIKPTKKLEENYSGQYDFLYEMPGKKMIKIEVKASRAVDFDSQEALYVKALEWGSKKRFDMNFQQVKPKCCDVFVWVGVWRDTIKYWVLASKEVWGIGDFGDGFIEILCHYYESYQDGTYLKPACDPSRMTDSVLLRKGKRCACCLNVLNSKD